MKSKFTLRRWYLHLGAVCTAASILFCGGAGIVALLVFLVPKPVGPHCRIKTEETFQVFPHTVPGLKDPFALGYTLKLNKWGEALLYGVPIKTIPTDTVLSEKDLLAQFRVECEIVP